MSSNRDYYVTVKAKSCLDYPGYKYEGPGICMKYVSSVKNWVSSRDTCQADGGSLVKIDSLKKNSFLKSEYGTLGSFWVGGNDLQVEGSWAWPDGTPIQGLDDWQDSEPDGGTSQNCMFISSVGWYNAGCTDTGKRFICEINL